MIEPDFTKVRVYRYTGYDNRLTYCVEGEVSHGVAPDNDTPLCKLLLYITDLMEPEQAEEKVGGRRLFHFTHEEFAVIQQQSAEVSK